MTHDRRDQVRGAGWEFVRVCIEGASRLAFAQIMPDEGQNSALVFLERALAYFASLGIKAHRLMSDNGSCYRSHQFRAARRAPHSSLGSIATTGTALTPPSDTNHPSPILT